MPTLPVGTLTSGFWPTVDDLRDFIGSDIPDDQEAKAQAALNTARSRVQSHTRQLIEPVASEVETLDAPSGCKLFLPELPVTAIASITVDGTLVPADQYTWDGETGIVESLNGWWSRARSRFQAVEVTYSHGFTSIPEDIRDVVLTVAARVYQQSGESVGLESETIQGYSYRAGPDGFSTYEDEVLGRYRLLLVG